MLKLMEIMKKQLAFVQYEYELCYYYSRTINNENENNKHAMHSLPHVPVKTQRWLGAIYFVRRIHAQFAHARAI